MKILLFIIIGLIMLPLLFISTTLILFLALGFVTYYLIKAIYLILTAK